MCMDVCVAGAGGHQPAHHWLERAQRSLVSLFLPPLMLLHMHITLLDSLFEQVCGALEYALQLCHSEP